MNIAPFKVGDIIEVSPACAGMVTNVYRVVTKIRWVGKAHSQSGWLVDAITHDPAHNGAYDLTDYDSDWFIKA
jgi:hypothetical protein